ncbi:MAG TPA: NAD(P)-dependent oxidoreductase [Gammaproteobacteria bacterium]
MAESTAGSDVVCLRPKADFLNLDVVPPVSLRIAFMQPDDEGLAAAIAATRALVIPAVGPPLKASFFENSNIELVQVTGAGVDRLDEAALRKLGIPVANVAGGSNDAIAEFAVATALTLLRRFAWADAALRDGRYADARAEMLTAQLRGLRGLTVGIVGMGTIGTAVATAFRAMGAVIVFFDPVVETSAAIDSLGAVRLPLEELLATADVVSLHLPLNDDTRILIDENALARMRREAILINAARGGIVDEPALAAALEAGSLAGAAIDVYAQEPPPADNPLLMLEGEAARRILFTPHIAGVTRQAWVSLFQTAWDNVVRVLENGEPPLNRVY